MRDQVFKDLKVVELASVLAGPAVGMFFAELGAQVLKIENKLTNGDITRSWKHPSENKNSKSSAYYHSINWGKEILFRNLKDPEEKEEVYNYIKEADIVISNFRDESAKSLGFDYDSIKKINPHIIFGLITAYGEEDSRPGFDALMQAETGWMHMNGSPDGPATKMPVALIDILTAHQLKEGILVALIQKLKTGKGAKVSASLYDSAIASLANQGSNYLNLNQIPQRKGSLHPNIAPYGEVLKSLNGQSFLLAIGNDKQFGLLCQLLQSNETSKDLRFTTNSDRLENRAALSHILIKAASKLTSDEILLGITKYSIPLGPINDLETVFKNKNSEELILASEGESGENIKTLRTAVFKLST